MRIYLGTIRTFDLKTYANILGKYSYNVWRKPLQVVIVGKCVNNCSEKTLQVLPGCFIKTLRRKFIKVLLNTQLNNITCRVKFVQL